jgi:hypothetical protein
LIDASKIMMEPEQRLKDVEEVLSASRRAFSHQVNPDVKAPKADPRYLSGDVASEFVFKKWGIDLSAAQADDLMGRDGNQLIRDLTYYTLPWYMRAVMLVLGQQPRYSAAACMAEYMRKGQDTDYPVFQGIIRHL